MTNLLNIAQMALWNIRNRLTIKDILDIVIVAIIIYELIFLTRKTRGSAVLKGLVLLLMIVGISNLIGLTALNWLLMGVITNGTVVLFILFQPELRNALEQVGRAAVIEGHHKGENGTNREEIITEITQCLLNLSKRRVGALIVFEGKTGLNDVIETGTAIDARISSPLLENIFEPNTPLHDGAVIIRGPRVVAAACILITLSDNRSVSRELGTRHRAGIGLSETTDAVVLIVSEETGIISMAKDGQLSRGLNEESLHTILSELYTDHSFSLRHILHAYSGKEKA